jgi:hypothetical protein
VSTLPVKMITPTSGSSRAKSNARFSSITVRGLNAFLRSGLLMVICRTAHKSDRYIHTGNSSHNTRPSMSQICAHSISLRPTDRYLHLPRTKRKEIRAQRENLSLSLSLSLSQTHNFDQFWPIGQGILMSTSMRITLAMPSPSAFSYKISSKGGPDGRRGCVQAGSSRDTEPCSCSYLLDLRGGGGGVSEAEQEESCSRDEDDGSTSVEACCCWQEGEMCRAIVAILCNAASSLRSMATMQKPQQTNKQTNKQTIDGRIVLLGLLFNFLTRTNRSLLAHQRSKQETKAMTKYVKTKWQNEDSRERKRERERERERERGWIMSPEFFSCCVVTLLLLLLLVRPIIIVTT